MALPQPLREEASVTQIVGTTIKKKGEKQREELRVLPQVLMLPLMKDRLIII